jgi:hypothetical protein
MTLRSVTDSKIHLLYFVCGRHLQCLLISLQSLRRVGIECIGTVYLYVDRDDFFTKSQIDLLHQLIPRLVIRESDNKTTGLGEQAIANQVGVFLEVGKEIGADDYLAKIDSDILFVSGEIFHEVLQSGEDAVGELCDYWEPFLFFQGGCYFIKGHLISAFSTFDNGIMPTVLAAMNNETARKKGRVFTAYTEDAVIYSFLKTKTERIRFTRCYGTERDICDLRKRFSLIHFQQTRPAMERNAGRNAVKVWLRHRLQSAGAVGQMLMLPIRVVEAMPDLLRRAVAKVGRVWAASSESR